MLTDPLGDTLSGHLPCQVLHDLQLFLGGTDDGQILNHQLDWRFANHLQGSPSYTDSILKFS